MKQLLSIAIALAVSLVCLPAVSFAQDCASAPPINTPCADDGNDCTTDLCDGGTICVHANVSDGTACSDDNTCTAGDMCTAGSCTSGAAVVNGTACDDDNSCTSGDACTAGSCTSGAAVANGTACDDDEACTSGDVCTAGACTAGPTDICTELTGAGKQGGYFRMTFPDNWDGDLVIVNHGFDLNDKHIRGHKTCSQGEAETAVACNLDQDCGPGNFCNSISYSGIDQIVLPLGKAIAAGTYSTSGWATFKSAKDIKDMLKYLKKETEYDVKRVIITGFSGGGAVTVDAMVKLKIDGAVPLCAASGGGLPTWDVAMDVRMVYDFLCGSVDNAQFGSAPDQGEVNAGNSGNEAINMALTVDVCLGVIGVAPHTPEMDTRLADFLALTSFDGGKGNVATAMGFATLGLGDFVRDPERLKGQRVGNNVGIDYSSIGVGGPLADDFDAGVTRLDPEVNKKGRKALSKAYNPTFTKGKGKSVDYPVVAMAGAADWLVIPEFQNVFNTALDDGEKDYTQTWIDTFGHCVFTEEETRAVFNGFFDWLGPFEGPQGTQPTKASIAAECIALGGVDGDTCNFNQSFVPPALTTRIPARSDWPEGAMP